MSERRITARLVRRGPEEAAFDREFWRRAGFEAIWAAAWEMVQEADRFRGRDASEPRLQRTVAVLRKREG